MIVACIELEPSLGKRKSMLEILQFVERGLRNNPACLSCGVYEKLDQNRTILYEEKWESEQSFRSHIRSTSYLALLNAMDLAQSKPKISFNEVTSTRSMELIENLRSREAETEGEMTYEDR
jgi:quinol monooxygenase YgiN